MLGDTSLFFFNFFGRDLSIKDPYVMVPPLSFFQIAVKTILGIFWVNQHQKCNKKIVCIALPPS